MRKYLLSFLILIALVLAPSFAVRADVTEYNRLTDWADIFTDLEEGDLEYELLSFSSEYNIDAIVVSMNDAEGYDLDHYMEIMHDNNSFANDCIFLGINMDPDNREVLLQSYGKCHKYVSDASGQTITDAMVPDLKNGDYVGAVKLFIGEIKKQLSLMLEDYKPQLPHIKKGNYFIDDANLFTAKQEEKYMKELEKINGKQDADLYVITIDSFDGASTWDYIDDLYAQNDLGENVAILSIHIGDDIRNVDFQPYGKTLSEKYLPDKRCQKITDAIFDDVYYNHYTSAMDKFLSKAGYAMNHKPPLVDPKIVLYELIASMIIGLVYIAILISGSSRHNQTTSKTYLKPGSEQVLARVDSYTHTTRTKHKIESSSSSGGSSGGHSSRSSGHSSSRSSF